MVQIYSFISDELYDKLRADAVNKGMSTSGVVRQILQAKFGGKKK